MLLRTALLYCLVDAGATKFVSRTLSPKEQKHMPEFLEDLRTWKYEKSKYFSSEPKVSTEDQWYQPLDVNQDRFHALGQLLILKPLVTPLSKPTKGASNMQSPKKPNENKDEDNEKWGVSATVGRCTAFYIAPSILATAAHCLLDAGVTKESGKILVFRQRYDGGKGDYSPADAKTYERVVREWAYSDEFVLRAGTCPDETAPCTIGTQCKDGSECKVEENTGKENGHDLAFLRTDRPSHGNAHYLMKSVDSYLPQAPAAQSGKPKYTSLITAGYPFNFAEFYRPAGVTCQLATADDELVTKDKGIKKRMKERPQLLENAKENQVFCIGKKGNMASGGSGGPWLLDASEVDEKDTDKAKKLRYVVGLTSWGITTVMKKSASSYDYDDIVRLVVRPSQKASVSPWFSAAAVNLANAAANAKDGDSLEDVLNKAEAEQK